MIDMRSTMAGAAAMVLFAVASASGQMSREPVVFADTTAHGFAGETGLTPQYPHGGWGMDILISTDGFGLGGFYRREFTPDIAGVASLSISESKDPREVDRIDPFTGVSYTPGKLNRFLVIPFMVGVQYRLFREDIIGNFRPYVNCGAGPTMIYIMPYTELSTDSTGTVTPNQVEYFSAIGKGHPRYTFGGFLGFGANFGPETGNSFGVNIRYYFTYLFSGGIPSLYDTITGQITSTKTSFGGFFITLNVSLGG